MTTPQPKQRQITHQSIITQYQTIPTNMSRAQRQSQCPMGGYHEIDRDCQGADGINGVHFCVSGCKKCGNEIVWCKHCQYNFAYVKSSNSVKNYFGRHLSRMHQELAPKSKKQKTIVHTESTITSSLIDLDDVGSHAQGLELDSVGEDAVSFSNPDADDGNNSIATVEDDFNSVISFESNCNSIDADQEDDYDYGIDDWTEYISIDNDHSSVYEHIANPGYFSYGYEDFAFFSGEGDSATASPYINNNQLFFWEQYRAKEENSTDNSGGWRSLCHRALVGNKKDTTRLASYETAELLYQLNEVLLNLAQGVRKVTR